MGIAGDANRVFAILGQRNYNGTIPTGKDRWKMMEYRQLPHGEKNEKFSVLGLGMGASRRRPMRK